MTRTYGATWEASSLPQPPFDLRVTSDSQQIVAKWVPSVGYVSTPPAAE